MVRYSSCTPLSIVSFSIVSLSLCLCISSYNAYSDVHGVGGRHCVSVVLIRCLPMDTPYIMGHVVDRGCDTPVESFVIGPYVHLYSGSGLQRTQRECHIRDLPHDLEYRVYPQVNNV